MAWRAAKSLLVFQTQLKAKAPQTAPALGIVSANEWGLIGDAAHDPTSDHAPHDFPGWGNDIVTAADFPNRPDLGLDAHAVLDNIRRSGDARVKYAISNGQMFSSYRSSTGVPPFTWRPYNGSDGHYTHGHLSVVGNSTADGTQPWQIGAPAAAGEDEEEMLSIEIRPTGPTSQSMPPVEEGWWPRSAALNVTNDTYDTQYALRVWCSVGQASHWAELPGWGTNGVRVLHSGEKASAPLPKGCTGLTISREPVNGSTYTGHLTAAIDFGPIRH